MQNPELLITTYSLSVVFGFVILPEEIPFAHQVELDASVEDVGKTLILKLEGLS